ncbi:conjugal transfer protein TraB [Streptomyces cacaoi]|uniref:conjugal transfer protein TraB n=1 Tax=Streptomyces cacaoi TaxID=1898 RepID=UPI001FD0F761|nr:conjugal transfer protein TraB [Streptomyces cacaoi]
MGTEIEPYTVRLPERRPALDQDTTPSFTLLAVRVLTLTSAAHDLKEELWGLKNRMETDASDADRLAEQCTAAEVEPRFISLMQDAATSLRNVADASADVAGAADQMESNARSFGDAHESEYRGVYEAVQARPDVRQPKPGFCRTR